MAARSGELLVTVRSGDTSVVRELRQELPELFHRLAENGYRSESLHPANAAEAPLRIGEERSLDLKRRSDDSQPQSGGSNQGQQQEDQQHPNPKWFARASEQYRRGSKFRREFHGISD